MFKHKFGASNVKSSDDLKKVKIGSSARERAAEVWATDELDALHVSILDSDRKKDKYASSLVNPFGVYGENDIPVVKDQVKNQVERSVNEEIDEILVDDAIDQLIAELVEESSQSNDDESSEESAEDSDPDRPRRDVLVDILLDEKQPIKQADELTDSQAAHKLVGIYSPNLAFISSVQKELELLGEAWVYCFDGSAGMDSLSSAPKLSSIDTWIINLTDDDEFEMLDTVLDESADANTMYLSGSVLSKLCKTKLKAFLAE